MEKYQEEQNKHDRVPKGKERWGKILVCITILHFPKLRQEIETQIKDIQRDPIKINPNRCTPMKLRVWKINKIEKKFTTVSL